MQHLEISALEQAVSADALGVSRLESGREVFPDGSSTGTALSWAVQTARKMNVECRIAGFWCFENPGASALAEMAERHDFLVVQDRFLVDGWMGHVSGVSPRNVFDLTDDADRSQVQALYGDRDCWEISSERKFPQVALSQHNPDISI